MERKNGSYQFPPSAPHTHTHRSSLSSLASNHTILPATHSAHVVRSALIDAAAAVVSIPYHSLLVRITNGVFADYFTVAVRTGGKGAAGLSLLLVEREFAGVTTRQMNCQGVWSSGTTYITFEDVKVPVANLIGKEGEGFKYVTHTSHTNKPTHLTLMFAATHHH